MRVPAFFVAAMTAIMAPTSLVRGAITLPNIIGDHMVLQRDIEAPIWGEAMPGEQITVTLGKQKKSVTADDKGKWMVKLDPLKSGGPFQITIAGSSTLILNNIWVGEVWVCSGQSNMT